MSLFATLSALRNLLLSVGKILFLCACIYYIVHYQNFSISVNFPWLRDIFFIGPIIRGIENLGLLIISVPMGIVILSFFEQSPIIRISANFFSVCGNLFTMLHAVSLNTLEEKFRVGFFTIFHQVSYENKRLALQSLFEQGLSMRVGHFNPDQRQGFVEFASTYINQHVLSDTISLMNLTDFPRYVSSSLDLIEHKFTLSAIKSEASSSLASSTWDWGFNLPTLLVGVGIVIAIAAVSHYYGLLSFGFSYGASEHATITKDLAEEGVKSSKIHAAAVRETKEVEEVTLALIEKQNEIAAVVEDLALRVNRLSLPDLQPSLNGLQQSQTFADIQYNFTALNQRFNALNQTVSNHIPIFAAHAQADALLLEEISQLKQEFNAVNSKFLRYDQFITSLPQNVAQLVQEHIHPSSQPLLSVDQILPGQVAQTISLSGLSALERQANEVMNTFAGLTLFKNNLQTQFNTIKSATDAAISQSLAQSHQDVLAVVEPLRRQVSLFSGQVSAVNARISDLTNTITTFAQDFASLKRLLLDSLHAQDVALAATQSQQAQALHNQQEDTNMLIIVQHRLRKDLDDLQAQPIFHPSQRQDEATQTSSEGDPTPPPYDPTPVWDMNLD